MAKIKVLTSSMSMNTTKTTREVITQVQESRAMTVVTIAQRSGTKSEGGWLKRTCSPVVAIERASHDSVERR